MGNSADVPSSFGFAPRFCTVMPALTGPTSFAAPTSASSTPSRAVET
jgi:hypothetical protein